MATLQSSLVVRGPPSIKASPTLPSRQSGIKRGLSSGRRAPLRGITNSHSPKPLRNGSNSSFATSAIAMPVDSPTYNLEDPSEREKLAEEFGFSQIGEPVPDTVTLKQIIDTLPPEVFEIDDFKAWKTVAISISSFALSLYMISVSPWYLLPLAWAFSGTAFTGFFVIGHDCAHKAFSKNKLVEDIVGTVMFMPLIYPYEPWRIKHDRHHAKTNMLVADTAWHPVMPDDYDTMPALKKAGLQVGMGPLRFLASIGHWLIYHFDLKKFRPSEHERVKISLAAVYSFMAIGWPLIIAGFGLAGWFKFWLMPWLGFHFWMSTFTMVHHTAPHIPFKSAREWNAAQAQLGGTIHCDYPSWVEFLCHDISVHIPHHVTQRIPSYNLRKAHESIRKNWGKYLNEATWNWRLMKTIFTGCHIYDPEANYLPFDHKEKSAIIDATRKVMPN